MWWYYDHMSRKIPEHDTTAKKDLRFSHDMVWINIYMQMTVIIRIATGSVASHIKSFISNISNSSLDMHCNKTACFTKVLTIYMLSKYHLHIVKTPSNWLTNLISCIWLSENCIWYVYSVRERSSLCTGCTSVPNVKMSRIMTSWFTYALSTKHGRICLQLKSLLFFLPVRSNVIFVSKHTPKHPHKRRTLLAPYVLSFDTAHFCVYKFRFVSYWLWPATLRSHGIVRPFMGYTSCIQCSSLCCMLYGCMFYDWIMQELRLSFFPLKFQHICCFVVHDAMHLCAQIRPHVRTTYSTHRARLFLAHSRMAKECLCFSFNYFHHTFHLAKPFSRSPVWDTHTHTQPFLFDCAECSHSICM